MSTTRSQELRQLENAYPELRITDDPTKRVAERRQKFTKVVHATHAVTQRRFFKKTKWLSQARRKIAPHERSHWFDRYMGKGELNIFRTQI